ncbi:MAG: T9SS type A sorting domain-containing protein, partial [Bacteroidetes bacterium]|nr:T9SS type A sorting domain-containing protein [Bacteroidota bacterium]
PNPFNPSTVVSFALKKASRVEIDLYNVIGQKVRTLAEGNYGAGGPYPVTLYSTGLASGVYFVRMIATSSNENYVQTRKVMIIK